MYNRLVEIRNPHHLFAIEAGSGLDAYSDMHRLAFDQKSPKTKRVQEIFPTDMVYRIHVLPIKAPRTRRSLPRHVPSQTNRSNNHVHTIFNPRVSFVGLAIEFFTTLTTCNRLKCHRNTMQPQRCVCRSSTSTAHTL